jgi:two-component system sensor histidine kinase PilS (NtrC family)
MASTSRFAHAWIIGVPRVAPDAAACGGQRRFAPYFALPAEGRQSAIGRRMTGSQHEMGAEGPASERRKGDRRRSPREPPVARLDDESWFGVLGVAADTLSGIEDSQAADSRLEASQGGDTAADRRVLSRQVRRILNEPDSALRRIYRTYAAARAAIGAALVAGIGATSLMGANPSIALGLLCMLYSAQAITLWLLPRLGAMTQPQPQDSLAQRQRKWLATIGVDLLAFTALHMLVSDGSLSFAALLVLPVLMSGVLTSRLLSLATASAVALMLLLVAWHAAGSGSGSVLLITQAGLAGMGFFAIALLSGELASRLAREEIAARGSMQLARQQAQLNRLVIEEMVDGVLVVDRDLSVRATNPAARSLLSAKGLGPAAPFQLRSRPEWSSLSQAVQRALAEAYWPEAGSDVALDFGPGDSRTLRMRVRFTRRRSMQQGQGATEAFCVLLLEDVRTAQARLRQEKLAAMGRVSAGIAHEIRNPLAAIAQANALLLEDGLPEAQQRLARMVADNVERLKRLVDEVMEVAPGIAPAPSVIDATAEVAAAAAEWARTAGLVLGADSRLHLDLPVQPLRVVFDPEHLRRVLVNLLDNAKRHCSEAPGAMGVRLALRDEGSVLLRVDSDGPPIAQEVERYLFEPFFSTRSRGSGLGLYICRELCERYGASIEYRLRPDRQRNLFLVVMRRDSALPTEARATPSA